MAARPPDSFIRPVAFVCRTYDATSGNAAASHAALLQMLLGKWVSSAISAAAHFGIADHLESGPKSPKELASLTGTQEQPLYRLLRATASLGVFIELEDGRFAQTPLSEPLRSNAKPCVRSLAMMLTDDWHIRAWEQLPWCVETGKPAALKLYGMGMFDWMAQNPEKTVNFNNAMTDLSQGDGAAVVQSYDFSRFRAYIVDVAEDMESCCRLFLTRRHRCEGHHLTCRT